METSFEEVWSRVTSGSGNDLSEIRRRIRRDSEIRRLCEMQLRRNIGSAARQTLYQLGSHAAGRCRRLQALLFLTGGSTWNPKEAPSAPAQLSIVLREIYQRLSESAGVAPDAAGLGPDAALLLRQTAEEAHRDAALLRRLAEKLL